MQPTNFATIHQAQPFSDNTSAGSPSPNGSDIRTIPPTLVPVNQSSHSATDRGLSLNNYAVDTCEVANTLQSQVAAEAPSYQAPQTASSVPARQGVNGARLLQEVGLARNNIQSHMDAHYPGKFALTIPDNNATMVIAEFVAPFGWWEGAYFKVEFDFRNTDKHNEGPSVIVKLAPPVAHLFDEELCLAQVIPHSAFPYYWKGEVAAKYSSYNFDRVQQMMNVINFLIMDTDFWDEGAGYSMGYPDTKNLNKPWYRHYVFQQKKVMEFSGSEGPEKLKRHISKQIASVNQRAKKSSCSSLLFEADPEMILRQKSESLDFSTIKPSEYGCSEFSIPGCTRQVEVYSREDLSSCVPVSPIVIEPDDERMQQLLAKNRVDVTLEHNGQKYTTPHKADYFYPVQLDPQGRVEEFYMTADKQFFTINRAGKIETPIIKYNHSGPESESANIRPTVDNVPKTYSLDKLESVLSNKLLAITSEHHKLEGIYFGNKKIENDDDLTEAITHLRNDISQNNRNRKNTGKLAVIFVKEPIEESEQSYYKSWKAVLKPTKTIAKVSNLASQYKLTISQETPVTTRRYRDGMQWGVEANAWLPVMDPEMQGYEKVALIKQLVDFGHKTLRLPDKRDALTAGDANNIIMKSMTMLMVDALKEGKDWLPSQCFLDLMVNAINTHYEIGKLYADRKYRNLGLMNHAFSGTLNKKNLKDFAFLINYLVSAWNQMVDISDQERDALRPRLVINAFIEYLVRVMEREAKNPETFAQQGLDNEAGLTLDKIINAAKTGFSVVAHQLTLLDFLLSRPDSLSRLTEPERDQLQSEVKKIQEFISPDQDGKYARLMQRLFPAASDWAQPVDFTSTEHQQAIIKTVLEKFHERTGQSSDADTDSEQPMEVDNTVPGKAFAVTDDSEYERLATRLGEQLAKLKLRKNVPVKENGSARYQQSCHYCGDTYTTENSLYETENPIKIKRQKKKGYIYRSGMPLHRECKQIRQEDTKNALSLIRALEDDFPCDPKKVQKVQKSQTVQKAYKSQKAEKEQKAQIKMNDLQKSTKDQSYPMMLNIPLAPS
ncbi:hypothetical protein [Endozoicomonas sp. ONNA2]|uniref:hypothetical protein n=1 Tax=Endozoicomonas sp. ONNA2 TaxID=2828741 RepID=UPI0021472A9B|nr:hypothetical protein [Endozoicomonas sp. ONNA2]